MVAVEIARTGQILKVSWWKRCQDLQLVGQRAEELTAQELWMNE